MIGTASGILVSFVLFPQRTSAATEKAVAAFLVELDRLLQAVDDRLAGNASDWRIYAVSRALDRRHAAILAASRPLGRNWASGARRRSVRIGRLRFAVINHWAHRLAAASVRPVANSAALRRELEACRRAIGTVSGADFFRRMATPPRLDIGQSADATGDELDPVIAVRAITHTLAQLVPEERATLARGWPRHPAAAETASQTKG